MKWTRGTGGVFRGDNEISNEATNRGEYVTTAYGPIGATQEPSSCEEYTDSKGQRVTRSDLSKLQSRTVGCTAEAAEPDGQGSGCRWRRQTSAASNRGSFASYKHAEPTFRLNAGTDVQQ